MDEVTVTEGAGPSTDRPLRFGDRYRPLALLGSGGMGTVYLARDEELGELVALKVLKSELLGDPAMIERFRDEVRLARRVSSPLVARTHDLAQHEGRWFVTMQYVEGETLSARLRRDGRLAMVDALPIARDVCDGLSAVHAAGVVHRDLKPANVLVATNGRAMLTDFGIALAAESASTRTDGYGTPTYVAPEQLAGAPVDARTDVFSLGALLFTIVTGQRPFPVERTGVEPAPDPRTLAVDLPDGFALLVMRAMALDPAERFESSEALRTALDGLTVRATLPTRDSALPGFVRSLGTGQARTLFVGAISLSGMPEALGGAARLDLLSRLRAQGRVRVVPVRGDAEAVLTGRFMERAGHLTLSVAIRSERDGYIFWSDSFDGPLLALPQLIARTAHAIDLALSPASIAVSEPESFPSDEVARLFLEARAEHRAHRGTRRSVDLLEQALELAPDHPILVAWYATALSRHGFFQQDPADHVRGREIALRAVSIAPDLAEARVALASAYVQEMRIKEAVPHFVAALRISPGLLEQRGQLARTLHESGAVSPALALSESTLEADATFMDPIDLFVRHHALRGRLDLAAQQLARAPDGGHQLLKLSFARYCAWWGDRELFAAHSGAIDVARLPKEARIMFELHRRLLLGEPASMDDIDALVGGTARRRAFIHQFRAESYAMKRDTRRTLEALESASEAGLFDVQWLDHCPLFDTMRGMLRFEAVRRSAHTRAIDVLTEVERCVAT